MTDELWFLWVNGIPEYMAAPIPDVIPGMISKGILLDFKNSASSPPLPKMNGSPPFNLKIFFSLFLNTLT